MSWSNSKTTKSEIEEEEEVGVFIDTSLGTHIAVSVSPHLTASQFIRKFESMHSNCYPQIGTIKVSGLMVNRKSCLYHLPESMPIKYVFQRSKGTWFLYVEAYPLNDKISVMPQSEVVHSELFENRTKNCRKARKDGMNKDLHFLFEEPTSERTMNCRKVRKDVMNKDLQSSFVEPTSERTMNCRKVRKDVMNKDLHSSFVEPTSERTMNCRKVKMDVMNKDLHSSFVEPTSEMSEPISVSGIIKKYFSVYDDEVTSTNSKTQAPKYAPNTPPEMTDKARGVGTRLVVAANNLGISASDKKPLISLCKYKFDKSSMLGSPSLMRHPVFEIGNE